MVCLAVPTRESFAAENFLARPFFLFTVEIQQKMRPCPMWGRVVCIWHTTIAEWLTWHPFPFDAVMGWSPENPLRLYRDLIPWPVFVIIIFHIQMAVFFDIWRVPHKNMQQHLFHFSMNQAFCSTPIHWHQQFATQGHEAATTDKLLIQEN